MRRVTIAVIGNGKTSRANVDALLGDFFDSVDKVEVAVLDSNQSEGIKWAIQFAESKSVSVTEYLSLKHIHDSTEELRLFVLWDDEDSVCQEVSAFSQEHNIPMFDLTDGLVRISIKADKIEPIKPSVMPEIEKKTSPDKPVKPRVEEEDEDEDDLEDDEDDEDDSEYADLGDILVEAFEEAAKVMAAAFVAEVKRLLQEQKDAQ
jgi:hypothetical protein